MRDLINHAGCVFLAYLHVTMAMSVASVMKFQKEMKGWKKEIWRVGRSRNLHSTPNGPIYFITI
jgi:hypothetical protein